MIGDNTLPTAIANEQGGSGMLTAALLEEVTRLAERSGLEVLETEPNPISSDAHAIQVRARLQMRGPYAAFVAMLDALARQRRLFAVERFTVSPTGATRAIDLTVSRLVLKRDGGKP
jgi:Tfp pilus assembly protein PilO